MAKVYLVATSTFGHLPMTKYILEMSVCSVRVSSKFLNICSLYYSLFPQHPSLSDSSHPCLNELLILPLVQETMVCMVVHLFEKYLF